MRRWGSGGLGKPTPLLVWTPQAPAAGRGVLGSIPALLEQAQWGWKGGVRRRTPSSSNRLLPWEPSSVWKTLGDKSVRSSAPRARLQQAPPPPCPHPGWPCTAPCIPHSQSPNSYPQHPTQSFVHSATHPGQLCALSCTPALCPYTLLLCAWHSLRNLEPAGLLGVSRWVSPSPWVGGGYGTDLGQDRAARTRAWV